MNRKNKTFQNTFYSIKENPEKWLFKTINDWDLRHFSETDFLTQEKKQRFLFCSEMK